jgi:hypothetical protein
MWRAWARLIGCPAEAARRAPLRPSGKIELRRWISAWPDEHFSQTASRVLTLAKIRT